MKLRKLPCYSVAVSSLKIVFVMTLFAQSIMWCSAENSKKYRVLIIWNYAGEYEWAKRIQEACTRLGWESCLSLSMLSSMTFFDEKIQHEIKQTYPPQYAIQSFKPDFTVSLKDATTFSNKVPNYMVLDTLFDGFFKKDLLPFDGFLQAFPADIFLKPYIEASGRTFHAINWYPSCVATTYQPAEPKKIFFCGFLWDGRRSSEEYKKLFTLLDMWGYFSVYGPQEAWNFIPHSWQGLLPFDGKSVSETIKKAGISLILHSYFHLFSGAPTARIFEAVSSGSIVITDQHPFIIREFGDSVLYVDENASAEEMFSQIRMHVEWIWTHPQEVQDMIQRAHAIFTEKFTLEQQMLNLATMHEKVKK